MPELTFDDVTLYYEEHGTGTPLLLVPGLGGVGAYWRPQIEAFSDDYRVMIHDHRGCGRSSRSLIDYSIEQMTRDLLRLMDALKIDRAHVVGHSTGGAMGQVMAIEHPDRLLSLTIANSWTRACPFRQRVMATRKALLADSGPEAYVRATPLFLYPSWWIRDHHDELEAAAARGLEDFPAPEIQISRIDAGLRFDRTGQLGTVTTPTLVIGAHDDHLTPAYYSEELADLIPGAALTIFDRGAHCCSQTVPEAFNDRLRAFLSEV
jgi:aminoacrylate hydrolase